jgi:hypothetical protein
MPSKPSPRRRRMNDCPLCTKKIGNTHSYIEVHVSCLKEMADAFGREEGKALRAKAENERLKEALKGVRLWVEQLTPDTEIDPDDKESLLGLLNSEEGKDE